MAGRRGAPTKQALTSAARHAGEEKRVRNKLRSPQETPPSPMRSTTAPYRVHNAKKCNTCFCCTHLRTPSSACTAPAFIQVHTGGATNNLSTWCLHHIATALPFSAPNAIPIPDTHGAPACCGAPPCHQSYAEPNISAFTLLQRSYAQPAANSNTATRKTTASAVSAYAQR